MKGRIQAEVGLLILPPQIQAVWGRLIKRLPGGPECLCQKPKGAGRGRVCLHRQLLQQARLPVHGQGGAGDDLPLFETVQRECVDPTGEKGQEYQLRDIHDEDHAFLVCLIADRVIKSWAERPRKSAFAL